MESLSSLVNKCIPPQGITLVICISCRQILGPSASQQSQVELFFLTSVGTIVTVTWKVIFLTGLVIRGLWLGVVLTYWSTFAWVDPPIRVYSSEPGVHSPYIAQSGVPDAYCFLYQVGNKFLLGYQVGRDCSTFFGALPGWERLSHPRSSTKRLILL